MISKGIKAKDFINKRPLDLNNSGRYNSIDRTSPRGSPRLEDDFDPANIEEISYKSDEELNNDKTAALEPEEEEKRRNDALYVDEDPLPLQDTNDNTYELDENQDILDREY